MIGGLYTWRVRVCVHWCCGSIVSIKKEREVRRWFTILILKSEFLIVMMYWCNSFVIKKAD